MNVMLDLETLGRTPGCVILSIGAVAFDPETRELGPEYYAEINQQSCVNTGLLVDPETAAWWKNQSRDAQRVLYATCDDNGIQLSVALAGFSEYLKQFGDDTQVWGNGSDFDQPILQGAYHALKLEAPWKFWNNRCHRTLKNLRPDITYTRFGTFHNALDDAKTQALHAIDLMAALTP